MQARLLSFVLVCVAGCGASSDEVQILAGGLFTPTDVAVAGERVIFTDANGEVHWVARDGAMSGTIAAAAPAQPGQIAIDPDEIDVAVALGQVAWTDHSGPGRLWTAPIDGGAAVMREILPAGRFADVVWDGARLCWLTSVALRCADQAGDPPRQLATVANPRALAIAGNTVYWLEAGLAPGRSHDGRLMAVDLDGSNPRVLATLLDDPVGLTIAGQNLYWTDRGTCTEGPNGCIANRNAALRRVALTGGPAITHVTDFGQIGALTAMGEDVYFCADSHLWRARGLLSDRFNNVACTALAAADGELFVATFDQILRLSAP